VRPRIVDGLNAALGTSVFDWLVPSPAALYACAMLAVLVVAVRRSEAGGLSRYHTLGLALWAMVGGLVGARVFFLLQHLPTTLARPAEIFNPNGGTASAGAYLGGILGLIAYCRGKRLSVGRYADLALSCLGLGIALGRISCFLNGDDFGRPADVPWAVQFPHGSYPFAAQARADLISPIQDLSLPVHPVQLYSAAGGLLLFALGTWCWRAYRDQPWTTFWLFWLVYSLGRFPLEFLRADHVHHVAGLSVPQAICLAVAPAAVASLVRVRARAGTLDAITVAGATSGRSG
jgi:phosphatidylglycerol:prolipoprotein diacylglycerol transferase